MADGGYLSNLLGAMIGREPAKPFQEQGGSGTAVWGGFVENIEKDPRLSGTRRYITVSDMLANVSIVAAGLRYFLNLAAVPGWSVEAAKDQADGSSSDAAQRAADFLQDALLEDLGTSWSRIVRRSGNFRFHGFAIQEWVAKRRPDGMIGLEDIEQRPQHTIEQWDVDPKGKVLGVGQRSPQTGELLYIPRSKFLYLVDDTLTDSPEGFGLFRQLIEPAEMIREYLRIEMMGYERDLRGIPIGKAPLAEINKAVADGKMQPAQRTEILKGLRNFLKMEAKAKNTSLMVDSSTYQGVTADGTTVSSTGKWGVELLNAQGTSLQELGKAIDRLTHDIARILGAENLLLGGAGGGNRALGEDKSRNLYLAVNGVVQDIREGAQRDLVSVIWTLNGLPEELKPTLKVEDVAFKDALSIAQTLQAMATAGAVLSADDPAIDDVRDLLGISQQPQEAIQRNLEMEQLGAEGAKAALAAPRPIEGQPPSEVPEAGDKGAT